MDYHAETVIASSSMFRVFNSLAMCFNLSAGFSSGNAQNRSFIVGDAFAFTSMRSPSNGFHLEISRQ